MSAADVIQAVVELAVRWAQDDSHGYDQANRWGPDYDCSSFLIEVWQICGVRVRDAGATYTGNMRAVFRRCGFKEVSPSGGLRPGDVLLNEVHHTAMYIGNGQIVQASINEHGGVSGGLPGDQTGREICIMPYYVPSYGWDCALRYVGSGDAPVPVPAEKPAESATAPQAPSYRPGDRYMVQPGDTLWGIAERYLGDGTRWHELYAYNHLTSTEIHVGDVIELPPEDWTEEPASAPAPAPDPEPETDPDEDLPVLSRGDTGQAVEALQLLLLHVGAALTRYGVDGDFGEETENELRAFQQSAGLLPTGTTTPATWVALLRG